MKGVFFCFFGTSIRYIEVYIGSTVFGDGTRYFAHPRDVYFHPDFLLIKGQNDISLVKISRLTFSGNIYFSSMENFIVIIF